MKETFASYGKDLDAVKQGLRSLSELSKLCECVPESHKEFYANLPLFLEGESADYSYNDFFIAHAYVHPQMTTKEAMDYDVHRKAMIWGRFEKYELDQSKVWGKVGYFGHTPTHVRYASKVPVFGDNIVLVDTGAVFGNCLSAVCHETKEIVISKHETDGLL